MRSGSACSPLMYHLSLAAGFDLLDVQLTSTLSPMWYLGKPPVIMGPSSGRSVKQHRTFINSSITFSFVASRIKNSSAQISTQFGWQPQPQRPQKITSQSPLVHIALSSSAGLFIIASRCYYSPTTARTASREAVWKRGASPETSQR